MVIIYVIEKFKNNKVLFLNILGSFGVKGFALIINLLTMPAYINFFHDQNVLGIWFSLLSILNWILMFDIGIGNGLRNILVEAIVEEDNERAKTYVSSA